MKFSKSILIFLGFSSLSAAFYYAFERTNGNLFKSLEFALFFLAIRVGLVEPNLPPTSDRDQSTRQPVSRLVYNPYVFISDDYRPSGLLMDSIERPPSAPHYSYSQNVINELRAGYSRVREAAWLLITVWMLHQQSVGFQPVRQAPPPPHRQLFGGTSSPSRKSYSSKSSQPSASLQMERPSAVPHQEYICLTKEQRRNLPDPRDGVIREADHPQLGVGYNQVAYKTPEHGKVHGLPTEENGKTLGTEANALALRDSIVDMPNRENIVWFENGGYQKGTERGYDSVNIFDPETGVIGVFKKQGNGKLSRFATTCGVTPLERDHLYKSDGNFMTEANLKQQNESPIQNNFQQEKGTNNDL